MSLPAAETSTYRDTRPRSNQHRTRRITARICADLYAMFKAICEGYLWRSDFADTRFLRDGSDLVDKSQRVREFLPARLKNRAFRRWDKLSKSGHVELVQWKCILQNNNRLNAQSWVQQYMVVFVFNYFLLGELPLCPPWSFKSTK